MQPHITVLTHISTDVTQPALYLTARNGQKYLIGRIGEGFQRSLAQSKTKTTKLSGVFLTGSLPWKSVSGVPGMLLSFGDRELGLSKLYCGSGSPLAKAQRMVASWQNFSFHNPLEITPTAEEYSDENVQISPITIKDSTSFVVKMKPVRGKFLVQKARALGVPPGPLFSELGAGRPVTLPDSGKVISPQEVLGPAPVPATALVLDLPTLDHVEQAIERFQGFVDGLRCESDLRVVYYFFESGVDLSSSLIQRLMTVLSSPSGSPTRHFISHPQTSPNYNTLIALSEFQSRFRLEFPDHFSPLYSQPAENKLNLANAEVMERLHVFSIEPREMPNEGQKDNAKNKNKKLKTEEISVPALDKECSEGLKFVPRDNLTEPEVITLGTGASAPSKYRNVASTLVRTPHGSVLFDCGEATYNTLGRLYGPEGRKNVLREVRVMYISHMHADHHLGGMQVLKGWIDMRKETLQSGMSIPKLLLAAPIHFHTFAKIWTQLDDFSDDFQEHVELLDLERVCFGNHYSDSNFQPATVASETNENLASVIGPGIKIETCTALHCAFSYNCSVTLHDLQNSQAKAYKLSYSGDTRPNPFFAETIGRNSDLLVHEATHENDLQAEAVKKRHSTIGEALHISQLMNAKNTVLTHISQRYPRLPTLDQELGADNNRFAYFGFDLMHTKLSQIQSIQEMIPKMGELLEKLEQADSDDP